MTLDFLQNLNIQPQNSGTSTGQQWMRNAGSSYFKSISPVDGRLIGEIAHTTDEEFELVLQTAQTAFEKWRLVPPPRRGEIVRQIGNRLRADKDSLGRLVSFEMGKILAEGLGEVQEMIDICDFAVGLSRQLYGLTIASEREEHRMMEQWHPLGVVGIISAFNFPVAVWSWNAILAVVCGNTVIWKPSEKVTLCAVAVQNIISDVLKENNLPEGIFNLVSGDVKIGQKLVADERIALLSATGSVRMGKQVGPVVAARLGKCLLELGGNNAIIVAPTADVDMALRAILFGAAGTTGQRCTSTRRVMYRRPARRPRPSP